MSLKQLFCNHYFRHDNCTISRSKRVGNDNYVITVKSFKCEKCNKRMDIEDISKIEKDFYK